MTAPTPERRVGEAWLLVLLGICERKGCWRLSEVEAEITVGGADGRRLRLVKLYCKGCAWDLLDAVEDPATVTIEVAPPSHQEHADG